MEKSKKITQSNEAFLFRLGLIKIEEMINDQSLTKVIKISEKDVLWAKKVQEEKINYCSNEIDGEFRFYPQKKIGFKISGATYLTQ